jgi:hypothetical protein
MEWRFDLNGNDSMTILIFMEKIECVAQIWVV